MKKKLVVACGLAACSAVAQAQSSVTLYGDVDEYLGYIRSSSGAHITGLNDGAFLRSRIGLRGIEELGGGYQAKFWLEGGFSADTGTQADSARFFDRQTWVGINGPIGEFRAGRQNTIIQSIGAAIDYTERTTFGSIINNFGVPSRYDNDLFYRTPRFFGLQAEVQYALAENGNTANRNKPIYQAGLDYTGGPFRAGYAGLWAAPTGNAIFSKRIVYHNGYFNYDYGKGKIYLAGVRSNNVTGTPNVATAVSNNSTGILSNISTPNNFFPGNNPDVFRFYNIYQVSADYRITSQWRVGFLYGDMKDMSHHHAGAKGGNIGTFYDLSKRTTLYSFVNYMKNQENAGFRFSGSAGPSANLVGNDINGKNLTGVQAGIVHRF